MNGHELDPEGVYSTHPGLGTGLDFEAGPEGGAIEVVAGQTFGPTRRAMRRLLREPTALVAAAYLIALLVATLTYKYWWPYSPTKGDFNNVLRGPFGHHWLGTDRLGRDIVARLFAGAGVSLRASFQVVVTESVSESANVNVLSTVIVPSLNSQ